MFSKESAKPFCYQLPSYCMHVAPYYKSTTQSREDKVQEKTTRNRPFAFTATEVRRWKTNDLERNPPLSKKWEKNEFYILIHEPSKSQ